MTELLNSFVTAISSPNELIISIISIPAMFLELYLSLLLFLALFNINASNKQKIAYVVINSVLGLITKMFIPSPFNIILNYIILFVVNYAIFRLNLLKTFTSSILPPILFALIGGLILNPYLAIFQISYNEILTIAIHRISYLIITYVIFYIIIFIIKHKNFHTNILDILDKKTKLTMFINLGLALATLCIQLVINAFYIDSFPLVVTFLSFITLLIYISVSIYSLIKTAKLVLTTQQLQSAEEYNKTLHVLHDSVREFKHDFDNIVTTIGGYVRTNDMEGLKHYYVQLEDDCQKVNNLYLLNPEVINNPGIYSLLTNKYHIAESKNIKINMTFLLNLKDLKMKIYEFAKILGILLDNAIEASSECEEKIINITFRDEAKNHRQLIIIENTYKNKKVDIENIFCKGITGKENHTGLGLPEVRNIVRKNDNANLYTTKTDKYFIQQLELYY